MSSRPCQTQQNLTTSESEQCLRGLMHTPPRISHHRTTTAPAHSVPLLPLSFALYPRHDAAVSI
eukprot:2324340-Rhodomonas_salina.4